MCKLLCTCVLVFYKYFLQRSYVNTLLVPNAHAQDVELVHLNREITVISPLDSWLSTQNPVNHFTTHLRPAKAKPYSYTIALIALLLVHHQVLNNHDLHFHVQAP